MTLDECYAANQGKALLIPGGGAGNEGQCVQWADAVLHDVYGFNYHWGNAIDWWNSPSELANNFDKISDGSIRKGDFVIFNTQVGSQYGHIDVAMQDGTTASFQGADSNWGGNKTVHLVQHTNPYYVLGSLRLKGGLTMAQVDDIYNAINTANQRLDKVEANLDSLYKIVDAINQRLGKIDSAGGELDTAYGDINRDEKAIEGLGGKI